ncbi:MAG: SDR family NAD(P)-dependent oxidoreductase [Phormidesmis sp.]
MANSVKNRVALVTGASSGLGKELAHQLLAKGAIVAGGFRKPEQAKAFESTNLDRAMGIVMDVTDKDAVAAGIQSVIDRFQRIDIVANCAGVGIVGAVEETSESEAREIFDINFFGGLAVNRAALPTMRRQQSGHILQFSAIGGFLGYPGLGVYSAAKGATDIVGEALASELKPLGINVTILTIGIFNTEFAGRSLTYTDRIIGDYANTPAGEFRTMINNLQGNQPNDPIKGATAIINLLEADEPPVHAALGADALGGMRQKLDNLKAELDAWEANATSTTY